MLVVATVPTVYGIETCCIFHNAHDSVLLQQYLPFTVLKLWEAVDNMMEKQEDVATVLTVYGIETVSYDHIVIS